MMFLLLTHSKGREHEETYISLWFRLKTIKSFHSVHLKKKLKVVLGVKILPFSIFYLFLTEIYFKVADLVLYPQVPEQFKCFIINKLWKQKQVFSVFYKFYCGYTTQSTSKLYKFSLS